MSRTRSEPMADSRDMYVIHDMFRREFAAIPALVGAVAEADAARLAIVADHVEWMVAFLHAHHEGEDLLVWPKLLARAPAETEALIHTMESQHDGLDHALKDLEARSRHWRATGTAAERDAVAGAASDLLGRIAEHLDLEEREVLSLIDAYLTDREWKAIGGAGLKKFSFGELKVSFGMILNEAGPEQVRIMRETIPRVPWTVFAFVGPRAYAKYAERLHGAEVSVHAVAA
jgi:hemerythrin-like domain-containing protein